MSKNYEEIFSDMTEDELRQTKFIIIGQIKELKRAKREIDDRIKSILAEKDK